MLVTITRRPAPKKSRAPEPTKFGPYKKYEPYQAYTPYARQPYQKYQGYKPYGHPDHPYKIKSIEEADAALSLRALLEKNRLALPYFTFVRVSGEDRVIIEVDPHDVQPLLDVVSVKKLEFSFDEDELPTSCSVCGHQYAPDEAKKGKCPKCKLATCKVCGKTYNSKTSRSCPHCEDSLPGIPGVI